MISNLDLWLLRKFMHAAHYIDWRWHVNNYRLASWFFRFAAFCTIGGVATTYLRLGFGAWVMIFSVIGPLLAMMLLRQCNELLKASNAWERDPTQIPRAAYSHIMMPPFARVMDIGWGMNMIALNSLCDTMLHLSAPVTALDVLFWAWNLYEGIGRYFAAVPPSPKKRKEKKVRDLSFGLMPSPVNL